MKTHYILGAADPEMNAIEALLREFGEYVHIATLKGVRVRHGERADGCEPPLRRFSNVVAIEVAGPWGEPDIDHHGLDPRASMQPGEYYGASSLGQISRRLNLRPSRLNLAIAAVDHCPSAAFAGHCPGVDLTRGSEQYLHVMEQHRLCLASQLTLEAFIADVDVAAETLRSSPWENHFNFCGDVRNLLHLEPDGPADHVTGELYPARAQFLPLAAAITGLGYVVRTKRADGRMLLRMGGYGLHTTAGTRPGLLFDSFAMRNGAEDRFPPNDIYSDVFRGIGRAVLKQ